MTATTTSQPIVQGKDLNKSFGKVIGLSNCQFELYPGEVIAVVGDNGAGKSTLIKCISGAQSVDSGEISVNGQSVAFKSTQDARAHGVETVYQTLAVAPALDIAENLYLGREVRKKGFLGTVFRSLDNLFWYL